MKILSLGLDDSIFEDDSKLNKRTIEYGKLLERYDVVVPFVNNKEEKLTKNVNVFGIAGRNKIIALLNIYKKAKKLIEENKYDLITVQDVYYLAFVGFLLKRKFKIGLELQVHGFEKFLGIRKIIAKFVIPRADAVRCVSQRLKKQLIFEFGVIENKITVVPIYVKIQKKNVIIKSNKSKFIFLTVGRLVAVKNIEMQLFAFLRFLVNLSDEFTNDVDVELWIVGDGPQRRKLEILSQHLKITKYVKFFGWIDDLDEIYQQADCFLLTSVCEGWGMVIVEAASYGLPIIMSDVGCAGEFVKDKESAIIISVDKKNSEELEKTMIEVYKNQHLREELGRNAQLALDSLLSWEETLVLYKKSWKLV